MPADLTLPGSIPGLLRRGSPIVGFAKREYTGVVLRHLGGGRLQVAGDDRSTPKLDRADLALDLRDATGRAHAAWWLGQYYALPSGGLPGWVRIAGDREQGPIWLLGSLCGATVMRFCAVVRAPASMRLDTYVVVPDLAGVDDDAEALRRVVLHVAEVPDAR